MYSINSKIHPLGLAGLLLTLPLCIPEMQAQSKGLRDNTSVARYEGGTAAPTTIWNCVETGDAMKHSFIHRQPNQIVHSEYLQPAFDTLCHSGRPLRVLHIGDSHVAGKDFPNSVKNGIVRALGTADNDSTGTGIYFSYLAKNGATAWNFLTPQRQSEIQKRKPDLIIMSFGTNECHGMGYRETVHLPVLKKSVELLHELCPQAVLLLTTPPGDYLSQRVKYYVRSKKNGKCYRRYRYSRKPNPMSARCAALIRDFGAEAGCAVWDLHTIAGGEAAVRNWTSHHLMRPDHIHFLPEGYAFQGALLSEAFLKAYNAYITARIPSKTSVPSSILRPRIDSVYVEY